MSGPVSRRSWPEPLGRVQPVGERGAAPRIVSSAGPRSAAERGAPRPHVTVVGLGPAGADLVGGGAADAAGGGRRGRTCAPRATRRPRHSTGPVLRRPLRGGRHLRRGVRRIVEGLVAAATRPRPSPSSTRSRAPRSWPSARSSCCGPTPGWRSRSCPPSRSWTWPGRAGRRPAGRGGPAGRRRPIRVAPSAEQSGPFLVAQCWSRHVLSEIKLAVADGEGRDAAPAGAPAPPRARRRGGGRGGLVGARPRRRAGPPHLALRARLARAGGVPPGARWRAWSTLVDTLRERCPWDRAQTHASLMPHLVEETYEVLDAIAGARRAERRGPTPTPTRISKRSWATSSSRSSSTPAWPTRRARSTWRTWPGACTTSWCTATRTSSATSARTTADAGRGELGGDQEGREGPAQRHRGHPGRPAGTDADDQAGAQGALRSASSPTTRATSRRRRGGGADRGAPARPIRSPTTRWPATAATRGRVGELLFAVANLAQRLGVDAEQALRDRALSLRAEILAAEGVPDAEEGNR